MEKLLPQSVECSLVHLCSMEMRDEVESYCFSSGVNVVDEEVIPVEVQALLEQYDKLFQEPTQLPPHRNHDHKIPLKEGINAVNVRLYRHSTLQKNVVEKMTKELLEVGLVIKVKYI